ncbi:hypothetical protein AC230_01650 [Streptomyces caatingaensis]|uniref:Uncharacterized protein n=1 Tax=Streptomyces caatingaensis TaxID=1678637 RepID=A0A0K9XJB6_9ACTN|nr:hypothetical protein AC230_01650 [Streptomyces caatingaensis]
MIPFSITAAGMWTASKGTPARSVAGSPLAHASRATRGCGSRETGQRAALGGGVGGLFDAVSSRTMRRAWPLYMTVSGAASWALARVARAASGWPSRW